MDVEGAKALAQRERGGATFVGQLAWFADAVGFAVGTGGDDRLIAGAEGFEAAAPAEGGPRGMRGRVGFGGVGYDGTC